MGGTAHRRHAAQVNRTSGSSFLLPLPLPLLVLPLLLLLLLPARRAEAHHPVSESGVAPVSPATVAELGLQVGAFTLGHESGTWQVLTPALEVGLGRRFSVGARLPLARLSYADDGHVETGLGDAELTVKFAPLLHEHDLLNLAVGLGLEVPTGDEAAGLSGGHFELNPFVSLASAWPRGAGVTWVFVGFVGARLSLAGDDEDAAPAAKTSALGGTPVIFHVTGGAAGVHGAVIAPHADRELVARGSAALLVGRWFGALGLEAIQVLDDVAFGALVARAEAGVTLGASWRIALAVDATVAGDPRFDWKSGLSVSRRF